MTQTVCGAPTITTYQEEIIADMVPVAVSLPSSVQELDKAICEHYTGYSYLTIYHISGTSGARHYEIYTENNKYADMLADYVSQFYWKHGVYQDIYVLTLSTHERELITYTTMRSYEK